MNYHKTAKTKKATYNYKNINKTCKGDKCPFAESHRSTKRGPKNLSHMQELERLLCCTLNF